MLQEHQNVHVEEEEKTKYGIRSSPW